MSPVSRRWIETPENLQLREDEIHVWKVDLNAPVTRIKAFREILSADEIKRADRFYFKKDRDAFTVARGALRHVLSRYLNFKPEAIEFEYNSYGKPFLKSGFSRGNLQFNLSHSHKLALIAVTCDHEVGIDVEYIRDDLSDLKIAERFFSKAEVAELKRVHPAKQRIAFFNCWTRKEAFIKAKGKGLSIPLDQFDVSLKPGEPAALVKTRYESEDAANWSIIDVSPESGYRGAIAIPAKKKYANYWLFST